jgi:hypothetical protein
LDSSSLTGRDYDVTPDGRRFFMAQSTIIAACNEKGRLIAFAGCFITTGGVLAVAESTDRCRIVRPQWVKRSRSARNED